MNRPRGPAAELGRFLEIQNLGLNLPFALGFLLLAARGWPPVVPTILLVLAFVGARNAGHAFNRWADRDLDARNPRTRDRALVSGRYSPATALGIAAGSAAVLLVAAALLNRLALLLAPVALVIVLGYSLTKRWGWPTTLALGLVESIAPAGVYVGLTASLPATVLLAVGGMLLWGTAFETIHSLGDLEVDRSEGLETLATRLGRDRTPLVVPFLHAGALGLLVEFGLLEAFAGPYFVALAVLAVGALAIDVTVYRNPGATRGAFRAHFLLGAIFLVGAAAAVLG